MVELLIAKGASLEIRDKETGATPLYNAASWGRTDVLEVLLEAGADPVAASKAGITPLQAAIDNGHTEAADILRHRKAVK
jgi:ankyrin repeat protein